MYSYVNNKIDVLLKLHNLLCFIISTERSSRKNHVVKILAFLVIHRLYNKWNNYFVYVWGDPLLITFYMLTQCSRRHQNIASWWVTLCFWGSEGRTDKYPCKRCSSCDLLPKISLPYIFVKTPPKCPTSRLWSFKTYIRTRLTLLTDTLTLLHTISIAPAATYTVFVIMA